MLDEELVLQDDVEGALVLLVADLALAADERHEPVHDGGVGVGEGLEGPGEDGLGLDADLAVVRGGEGHEQLQDGRVGGGEAQPAVLYQPLLLLHHHSECSV